MVRDVVDVVASNRFAFESYNLPQFLLSVRQQGIIPEAEFDRLLNQVGKDRLVADWQLQDSAVTGDK